MLSSIAAEQLKVVEYCVMAAYCTRSPRPGPNENRLFAIIDLDNAGVETQIMILRCIAADLWLHFCFYVMAA